MRATYNDSMSETQNVLASFEIIDGVALIKLDDGKANALSLPMQQAFNSALDQAQQAKLPVVITGRSGILSAGFDLKTLAASGQPAVDMLNGGIEIALRLLSFETPVVIACGGHAIAMGVFLLQCGDYRIGVAGNFKYSANEVAIGMTMPWSTIESSRLRRHGDAALRGSRFRRRLIKAFVLHEASSELSPFRRFGRLRPKQSRTLIIPRTYNATLPVRSTNRHRTRATGEFSPRNRSQ